MADIPPPSPAEPENLAINNTFLNRLITILALKTVGRLYNYHGIRNHKYYGICTPISKHKIIKASCPGARVRLIEAQTMRFIAEHTSIPVPTVYCSFVRKGRTYIVMERVQGEDMMTAWERLGPPGRAKIFAQLKTMLQELRSLKRPSSEENKVESCVGGSLYDSRIIRHPEFGPFSTIQDFHLSLRGGLKASAIRTGYTCTDDEIEEIAKMVAMQDAEFPPTVFTHGDLNPANIIIRGDRVVSIIDWEFAGWYPSYWEYSSAYHGMVTQPAWQDIVHEFLDPYPEELDMERVRYRWWGSI